MKIAVTYESGLIFQHFGHTSQFKIYEIESDVVKSSQVIGADGFGHGALAGLLAEMKIEALICGGIGMGAQQALALAGIELYAGQSGEADVCAQALAEGRLAQIAAATCSHHHDHEHGHDCGSHGCGSHTCGKH